MPTTTGYEFGDVFLVPFPFTDQRTTKRRPAGVLRKLGRLDEEDRRSLGGVLDSILGRLAYPSPLRSPSIEGTVSRTAPPAARSPTITPIPIRWLPDQAVTAETSRGPAKEVAFPARA